MFNIPIFTFIVDLQLETFFSLNQKLKLICLPGVLKFLKLDLVSENQSYNETRSVAITWIKQTIKTHYHVNCTKEYCNFTYLLGNVIYWLFGNIPYFYRWLPKWVPLLPENYSRRTTSWNKASELCESVGASLPYFNDRNQLTDFLQFLRQAKHIPPLEAIYIGLYYDKIQV